MMLEKNDGNLQNLNEDEKVVKQEISTEPIDEIVKSDEKSEVEVVDEIEEKIAESSEKIDDDKKEEIATYEGMSLENLVDCFDELIKSNSVQKINKQVNAIKKSFDEQFSKLLAEKKAAFIEDGGNSIDFNYANPLKNKFNELLNDFRDSRTKYYKNLETELKENLEIRLSVIEELKGLIEDADPKTMYNKFRDIQIKWKKIGPVVRERYNDTWKTYHHHVERFYDLLHMSNDFRDLDFKHNLEEKLKLIVKVEALAANEDVNYAFKQLQVVHKRWKEEVGPVAREFRDEVWDKFSAATKKIHDKRHENFKKLRSKYEENITKKIAIIEEINTIDTSKNSTHSDWQQSIKEVDLLREKFFKAGNVPKSESDKIWNQFKEATKEFNKNKNTFYKNVKGVQQENLDKKLELIQLAESLKDSDDWNEVTGVMKKIQADWRKIGHVPRKDSDKIWNQFKGACNHYFDRLHTYQNEGSKEEQEIFENKKTLLETITKRVEAKDVLDLDNVKTYINDWRSLGKVPYGMRHIEAKFSKVVDELFSNLSIDKKQKEMIKFENQIEGLLAQNNLRKLETEQLQIRKKIAESVKEIHQLENNISFFANAKADNPLLKNVIQNIENQKNRLDVLKSKLSYLTNLDIK